MFSKATKEQSKARIALLGPPGSGKTFTALRVAAVLADQGRVALIDTERGSASKYADRFDFDTAQLDKSHSPDAYIAAIRAAAQKGYAVLVIDSMSHEWAGAGGALEMKDRITAKSASKNSFSAWGEVTPKHQHFIDAVLSFPGHVIGTMRSKTAYVIETNDRGKQEPRKVGTSAVQRDGVEYEFDIVGELDQDNLLRITKSRCPELTNETFSKPGEPFALIVREWLSDGEPAAVSLLVDALGALESEAVELISTGADEADAHKAIVGWLVEHGEAMGALKRADKSTVWEVVKKISEGCGTSGEEMLRRAMAETEAAAE